MSDFGLEGATELTWPSFYNSRIYIQHVTPKYITFDIIIKHHDGDTWSFENERRKILGNVHPYINILTNYSGSKQIKFYLKQAVKSKLIWLSEEVNNPLDWIKKDGKWIEKK